MNNGFIISCGMAWMFNRKRILLIEDNDAGVLLIERELAKLDSDFDITRLMMAPRRCLSAVCQRSLPGRMRYTSKTKTE